MVNTGREQLWQERVAQWQASGLSQRAYAIKQGFPIRQVGYWVRRLSKSPVAPVPAPALLPVRVAGATSAPAVIPATVPISLCGERGWTLNLPTNVPASWLAELMRAL